MFGAFEAIYSFLTRQVGLRTDAADAAGSLHAKVKNIADNKLGSPTDVRTNNTVMGWLNTQVKSLQRGVTTITAGAMGSAGATVNITIGSVDLAKAIVIVTCSATIVSSNTYSQNVFLRAQLTSSTNLELYYTGSYDASVSWQVIEFY